jgi:hypothetical protein
VCADKEMIQQHQTNLHIRAVFLSFPKETYERVKQSSTEDFYVEKVYSRQSGIYV